MTADRRRRADVAVARSSAGLSVARLIAQVIAFAWFVVAARTLPRAELGELAIGLTVMALASALGELGVNRTLTRQLATGLRVRPTVRRAVRVRVIGGAIAGPVVAAAALAVGVSAPAMVVVLAIVASLVSGLTDLQLAALRATRSVDVEIVVLVGERLVFLAAAWWWVAGGGGATGVMAVYLVTNALSAVAADRVIRRDHRTERRRAAPMLDAEGRRTAVQSAISLLLIRIAPVSIAAVSTATMAGGMSLVHRPVEAAMWVGATALSVVHPEARRRAVAGERSQERRLVGRAAIVLGSVGILGVAVLWPLRELALRLLSGGDGYADVGTALVGFATVCTISLLRQAAEVSALAEERAGDALRAGALGLAAGVLTAWWWVPGSGISGAIAAQGLAELVALAAMLVLARRSEGTEVTGRCRSVAIDAAVVVEAR